MCVYILYILNYINHPNNTYIVSEELKMHIKFMASWNKYALKHLCICSHWPQSTESNSTLRKESILDNKLSQRFSRGGRSSCRMGRQTGRGITPLSHEGAAVELQDNHAFVLCSLSFSLRILFDTFNSHWEGRGDPDSPKGQCVLACYSLSTFRMLTTLSYHSQLLVTCSLWVLGEMIIIISPTFH